MLCYLCTRRNKGVVCCCCSKPCCPRDTCISSITDVRPAQKHLIELDSLEQQAFLLTRSDSFKPCTIESIKNQTNRKEVLQSEGSGFQTLIKLALASIAISFNFVHHYCKLNINNATCISWYNIGNSSIILFAQVLHIKIFFFIIIRLLQIT